MYHVHVSKFEGPLDLLLHLIESAELDIKDIFISEITAQYLSYMDQLDDLDMDTASEFLAMAATLLYIKSRQLLPRPPSDEAMFEEDPEVLLIRQLHEYKLFKRAGEALLSLQLEAQGMYSRLPEEILLPEQELLLSGATLDGLYQSFFALMHAQKDEREPNSLHQVREDEYTVRMQIAIVRDLLKQHDKLRFTDIFGAETSKLELVVTFMALLEMLARSEILLKQPKPFAPIFIYKKDLHDDDADEDYMDESGN